MPQHAKFLIDLNAGRLKPLQVALHLVFQVLDTAQLEFLKVRHLTVGDVLSGRYLASDRTAISAWMHAVNAQVGGEVFASQIA